MKIATASARITRNFCYALLFFLGLTYLFALIFQPDWSDGHPWTDDEVHEARELRRQAMEAVEPVEPIYREVDYAEGPAAAWWPRAEAPVLAGLVADGVLPPVAERVGPEPLVMEGPEGIGKYGGNWLRLATTRSDFLGFINSRLAGPALVRSSPDGQTVHPHAARGWDVSDDKRVWTIHLRRGMRWSDGHPVTADDILFIERVNQQLAGGAAPRYLMQGADTGKMEKVDDYTVRYTFNNPNPSFIESLTRTSNVFSPSHYLEAYLPETGDPDFLAAEMNRLSMPNLRTLYRNRASADNPDRPSLSPWIYVREQPTAPYLLVRNPYYWAVDTEGNQLPYIDQVHFDERSVEMLPTSAYEGAVSMQHRHLRFKDYTLLMTHRGANNYELYHWTDPGTPWVIWPNLNRVVRENEPASKWKHQLLNDRRFRQALSIGIDREEIIDAIFAGVGSPAQPAPYPGSPYFDPELRLRYTEYDPQRAKALLDELGLTQRDSEGYRTFPDGSRMTWFLDYGGFIDRGATPFVVEYWRRLGLRTIERERSAGLLTRERNALRNDFSIWDIFNIPLTEAGAFVPASRNSRIAQAYGRWFELGGLAGNDVLTEGIAVQEPAEGSDIRRAMEYYSQALESVDPEVQLELFRKVMELASENVWAIAINTPPPVLAIVRNDFRNVSRRALAAYTFLTISNLGPEIFFFDDPQPLSPGAQRRLQEWIALAATPALEQVYLGDGVAATVAIAQERKPNYLLRLLGLALLAGLVVGVIRHPMVGRRLLVLVPTLMVMSVGIFIIIQIPPGDFVETRIAELEAEGDLDAIAEVMELRELFHMDESVVTRYFRWTGLYWFVSFRSEDTGLLQGNLGRSMATLQPVNEMVGDRLLLTVLVTIGTILFTYAMAIPIGIYSAIRQYSVGDYLFTIIGFLGLCVPNFLLALLLMYYSSRYLGLDATGLFSPEYATQPEWTFGKIVDLLKHIWIPVVVVGTSGTAGMIRVMRGNLLDELRKPYVVTARAKGVRPASLLLRYPVRMAINPFISNIGGIFPRLVSGEAIVAIVISLPTVGPLLLLSLMNQDMYMAGSLLMFLSMLGVIGTMVSDLLLMAVDPRIRVEQ